MVGKVTWYKLVFLYVGVSGLSELVSEGQRFFGFNFSVDGADANGPLENRSAFAIPSLHFGPVCSSIPFLTLDGIFGPQTEQAVQAVPGLSGVACHGRGEC